ncbi:MAG: hypothetical protein IKK69_05805 [Firmicutes bacterium]|nr:hypothetical protein [Bacillota bacterium]
MAKFDAGQFTKNTGRLMKGAAALVAAAAFAVASMTAPPPDDVKMAEELFSAPAPVVMTIDEVDEAIVEESAEEEKVKKMGLFTRIKLAFYSLCAAYLPGLPTKYRGKRFLTSGTFT